MRMCGGVRGYVRGWIRWCVNVGMRGCVNRFLREGVLDDDE